MITKTGLLSLGLFLSIIFNLMLGGLWVGHYVAGPVPRDSGPLAALNRLERDVPQEQKTQIDALLAKSRDDLRAKYKALQEQRLHIHQMLAEPNLDQTQLEEAFAKYRADFQAMQAQMHEVIAQAALVLPPKSRAHLVEMRNR
jgi:uncharacterized membrane protein